MSVESPPARINLLKLDSCLDSKNRIEEVVRTEVRGGIGNSVLVSFQNRMLVEDRLTKLKLEEQDRRIAQQMRERLLALHPDIDYIQKKNYPKEWENIKLGRDNFKLSNKDKGILAAFIVSVFGLIGWIITMLL